MNIDEYKSHVSDILRHQSFRVRDSNQSLEEMFDKLSYHGPDLSLFQYRRVIDEVVEGLKYGSIVFSSPLNFNDPFDSLVFWNEERLSPYFENESNKKIFDKFSISSGMAIANQLRNCFRASCFTEVANSQLMWAHYADGGKGICVEYEFPIFAFERTCIKDCQECIDGRFGDCKRSNCDYCSMLSLLPVIYLKERPDATDEMIREIEYMLAHDRGRINELDLGDYDYLAPLKVALFKQEKWSYEKEWRLVFSGLRVSPDQYCIYPFMNMKRVILGWRINVAEEYKVRMAIEEYAKNTGHPVEVAKVSANIRSRINELDIVKDYTAAGV